MEPGLEHFQPDEFFDHLLLLSSASSDKPELVEMSESHRIDLIAFGNPAGFGYISYMAIGYCNQLWQSAGGKLNSGDGATGGLVLSKKISRGYLEVTQE